MNLLNENVYDLAAHRNLALSMIREDVADVLKRQGDLGGKSIRADNLFAITQSLDNKGNLNALFNQVIVGEQNITITGDFNQTLINSDVMNQNIFKIIKTIVETKEIKTQYIDLLVEEMKEVETIRRTTDKLFFFRNKYAIIFINGGLFNNYKKVEIMGYTKYSDMIKPIRDFFKSNELSFPKANDNKIDANFSVGRYIKPSFLEGEITATKLFPVYKDEDDIVSYSWFTHHIIIFKLDKMDEGKSIDSIKPLYIKDDLFNNFKDKLPGELIDYYEQEEKEFFEREFLKKEAETFAPPPPPPPPMDDNLFVKPKYERQLKPKGAEKKSTDKPQMEIKLGDLQNMLKKLKKPKDIPIEKPKDEKDEIMGNQLMVSLGGLKKGIKKLKKTDYLFQADQRTRKSNEIALANQRKLFMSKEPEKIFDEPELEIIERVELGIESDVKTLYDLYNVKGDTSIEDVLSMLNYDEGTIKDMPEYIDKNFRDLIYKYGMNEGKLNELKLELVVLLSK